jgi:hypothetical protein
MTTTTWVTLGAIAGVVFISTLLFILARKPEKSAIATGFGIAMTFVIGLLFTLLVPSFNSNWSTNTAENPTLFHNVYNKADFKGPDDNSAKPLTSVVGIDPANLVGYTPLQQHGRLVYQREGCMYCHSQQIRPLDGEMRRYSIGTSLAVPAMEREYIWDQPHFLGTRRIGPDLSREGGKYSDDWHYSHFYNPRQMVPGSIMPVFAWLFTFTPDDVTHQNPIPTPDARALVAYVQTLGYGRKVPDGKGGWRSWLKPEDQQASQNLGVTMVLHAAKPVRGGDLPSATNRVPTPPINQ